MLQLKLYYKIYKMRQSNKKEAFSHHLKDAVNEHFEDGTVNYLVVTKVRVGLDFLKDVVLGTNNAEEGERQFDRAMTLVHRCTLDLTESLYQRLSLLQHFNHTPVCQMLVPVDVRF